MTITTIYPPARPRPVGIPAILVIEGLSGGDTCIEAAGGYAISLSPYQWKAIDEVLAAGDFHGVLLTGGGDVDPTLYGQKPHAQVYGINQNRDLVEVCVLERARELNVPVMGICRGAQIMAVEGGGSLIQHIQDHRGGHHPVYADKASLFHKAAKARKMDVVSLHHQEIDDPGEFNITAWAEDGTVEVIESDRCIGVQFHPEMDEMEAYAQNLFRWLVIESARRAKMPTPATHWNLLRSWKGNSTWKMPTDHQPHGATVTKTDKFTGESYVTKPASQSRQARERRRYNDSWDGWNDDCGVRSAVSKWAAGDQTPLLLPPGPPKPHVRLHADGRVELMSPKPGDHTVYSRHLCKFCGLIFDDPVDRDDHVAEAVCRPPDTLTPSQLRSRSEQIVDERMARAAVESITEIERVEGTINRILARLHRRSQCL